MRKGRFTVNFHRDFFHLTVRVPCVPITNPEGNSHFTVELVLNQFESERLKILYLSCS